MKKGAGGTAASAAAHALPRPAHDLAPAALARHLGTIDRPDLHVPDAMPRPTRRFHRALLLLLTAAPACAPSSRADSPAAAPTPAADAGAGADPSGTAVQPGAPGQPSRRIDPGAERPGVSHTEADVRFVREMMVHHAQALEMAALVAERTGNEELRLLARRLDVAQRDEISLMRSWLSQRGEEVTEASTHAGHEAMGMPGMLSAGAMERLAAARGTEFDRLFLESMIAHHEGALVMVERLFAAGGGQEPSMYQLATEIDGDQRIEIDRMRAILAGLR